MKKILILEANPQSDLSLNEEIRHIRNVISRSRNIENSQQLDTTLGLSVKSTDLQGVILDYKPNIIHFCGHGTGEKGLVFRDRTIDSTALSNLLELFKEHVECVVLNACYSEIQEREIAKHVDYLISMNQEIKDNAAIAFSTGFYQALAYGKSYEHAFKFGSNAIQLEVTDNKIIRKSIPIQDSKFLSSFENFQSHHRPILYRSISLQDKDIETIKNALSVRYKLTFQNYPPLINAIFRRMGVTNSSLLKSSHFKDGSVWKVDLPKIGLRLRNQDAVIFLKEEKDSNSYEYLSEIAFENQATLIIIIDTLDIRSAPIQLGIPTIWFRPESLLEMAKLQNRELLNWLSRFIMIQIDPIILQGILPYQTRGVAKEELFFGREYELLQLISGDKHSGAIIVGAHRSGKTSLLSALGKRLKQLGCQSSGLLTLGGMESYQTFLERTLDAVNIELPKVITLESWASIIRKSDNKGKRLIFLLDEVDDLIKFDAESGYKLGKQMRSLQSDGYCEFYLAGHAQLRKAVEIEESPYRNFAEEITLKGLNEKASKKLIQQPMNLIGFEIPNEQADKIFKGTAGVAVLIQEFCVLLLQKLKSFNVPQIENTEIEKIEQSPEYLSIVFDHFKYAQNKDSMAVTLIIAIRGEINKRDIIKEFTQRNHSLKITKLDKILSFLVRFGVLDEFKSSQYRILPIYLNSAIKTREPELLLEAMFEEE